MQLKRVSGAAVPLASARGLLSVGLVVGLLAVLSVMECKLPVETGGSNSQQPQQVHPTANVVVAN